MSSFPLDLLSRFDQQTRLQLQKMEYEARTKYQLVDYEAHSAMQREHVRGGYEIDRQKIRDNAAYDRERFKSDREDSRQDRAIGAQFDLERTRGENNLSLARAEHENALDRMEEDLLNHITRAGVDSGILATHKIIDEDTGRRQSLMRQMEARSQLRGEVFKMLAGAIIQEKLAQKQHVRDMEKLEKESANRRADTYIHNVSSYLTGLLDKGRKREAKQEVDRLLDEWNSVYK